jgi:hypothetical protein
VGNFKKYWSCIDPFNNLIDFYRNKCLTKIRDHRQRHYALAWFTPTYECSDGLTGFWNRESIKKTDSQLNPVEKAEVKFMTESNKCLNLVAYRNNLKTAIGRRKGFKPAFKPDVTIVYALCINKLVPLVAEEEENLKKAVPFYPNFPESIEAKYNQNKEEYKNQITSVITELNKECEKIANKKSGGNKCEDARIFNRCVTRTSEVLLFWNRIDRSISPIPKTLDEESACGGSDEQ